MRTIESALLADEHICLTNCIKNIHPRPFLLKQTLSTWKRLGKICTLHETLGHIDLAIACAGTGEINATLDYAVERPTIDTNVVGWTFVIDMLYHIFERQGCGYLVAITSAGGLRGEPMAPAYSATKAYQINYMEALRKKAFKNGGHIIVTDIRPGLVDTAMAKGEGLFWVMPVEKVANQIITAIRKKKSKAYVTKRWHILAIINKILPYCLYKPKSVIRTI